MSTADESREGREGTSRQGGGEVEESRSDDDLEVTWESDTPDAAKGTDDAITDKPVASEGARVEVESGGTWLYNEAVGGLMWLIVMSRPDISNAIRIVSRHSNSPAERHWKAVLLIIRYLLGTKGLSLTFEWGSGLDISVFTDANYADKADDRRSVSGVAVTVGKSTVSWCSSTQKIATLSTTEAEYVALGMESKKLCFGSEFFLSSFYLSQRIATRYS